MGYYPRYQPYPSYGGYHGVSVEPLKEDPEAAAEAPADAPVELEAPAPISDLGLRSEEVPSLDLRTVADEEEAPPAEEERTGRKNTVRGRLNPSKTRELKEPRVVSSVFRGEAVEKFEPTVVQKVEEAPVEEERAGKSLVAELKPKLQVAKVEEPFVSLKTIEEEEVAQDPIEESRRMRRNQILQRINALRQRGMFGQRGQRLN